jgi:hypothetical protein
MFLYTLNGVVVEITPLTVVDGWDVWNVKTTENGTVREWHGFKAQCFDIRNLPNEAIEFLINDLRTHC